jgi:hypothetical protein
MTRTIFRTAKEKKVRRRGPAKTSELFASRVGRFERGRE